MSEQSERKDLSVEQRLDDLENAIVKLTVFAGTLAQEIEKMPTHSRMTSTISFDLMNLKNDLRKFGEVGY